MSGFPTRALKSQLSIDKQNIGGQRGDPRTHRNEDEENRVDRTVAGCNLLVDRAAVVFLVDSGGPSVSLVTHEQVWKYESNAIAVVGALSTNDVALNRTGAGVYTVEFQTPVTDIDGESVALEFMFGQFSMMEPSSGGTALDETHVIRTKQLSAVAFQATVLDTGTPADLDVLIMGRFW